MALMSKTFMDPNVLSYAHVIGYIFFPV